MVSNGLDASNTCDDPDHSAVEEGAESSQRSDSAKFKWGKSLNSPSAGSDTQQTTDSGFFLGTSMGLDLQADALTSGAAFSMWNSVWHKGIKAEEDVGVVLVADCEP
ncbi:hypothetical protein Q7C36_017374 [Tachysurus vachellii]|uniref:Uncharacterized protein n=1 Tax=Tachysurus vachellii TaxID=175792 RepID=A0AA88M396_TACVA|nr:hypothetical protein Q7C36_017374 [Tachysurus vachellii]